MEVFNLRDQVIGDYGSYIRSFVNIRDARIEEKVDAELKAGFLWPDPLVQLNPSFMPGESIAELVQAGELHPECENIFRDKPDRSTVGAPLRFHRHQVEGIRAARRNENYVLTTGTGSGKSLSYIVPIVDHVLRRGSGKGTQAIIVYPMNALANSQLGELEKFLHHGYPDGAPVTFRRYTGQESEEERKNIIDNPPDILLTNYVMLELVLTRPHDSQLIETSQGLRFLVFDELHTYRGRQGADVALLTRRVREACNAENLLQVGTSATLSTAGTWGDQQREISNVASRIFGAVVKPDNVIGETLKRATLIREFTEASHLEALVHRVKTGLVSESGREAFLEDPLASWIESELGLYREPIEGRLVRCIPKPISGEGGAAQSLAELTGLEVSECESRIKEALLYGYNCLDEFNRPLFAFRLHQFVSKGDAVYASLEPEKRRTITLLKQIFVPNTEREKVLLPMAFCRECGQEYFTVRRVSKENGATFFEPRGVSDRTFEDEESDTGFLYLSSENPWPEESDDFLKLLPESWLEMKRGEPVVKKNNQEYLPQRVKLGLNGELDAGTQVAWWLPTPFRFCLQCGMTYGSHQRSDFGKLGTLGSEGRSTATTVMTLSTMSHLRATEDLVEHAKKLLSFTDNRQDASLQAGHFNDFIEVVLLRSALWRALKNRGDEGVRHDQLTNEVFQSLDLPLHLYSKEPNVKYAAKEETERAFREVIGYLLYLDLRRGWRITSPNLEQCGLLSIDYLSLDEFCADDSEWQRCHPALSEASAATREEVCRTMLDFFRRELAIGVKYLSHIEQESMMQLAQQRLIAPWSFERMDKLERARSIVPSPAIKGGPKGANFFTFMSPRGGFGQYLRRPSTFTDFEDSLKTDDISVIIQNLCEQLVVPGLLDRKEEKIGKEVVNTYRLKAAAMIWKSGEGSVGFHDHIRVPRAPRDGHRTNDFFTDFYQRNNAELRTLEAREHTAQVPSEQRETREDLFRQAKLPILYCSPTMELGVDISQLNVVNMRNVPPTPANYAQRSGRAGRSGQPAFVFTYCSAGSPHDQYFFRRPELMVAGSVTTPRLDLANEDLLRAHVHAIWLGESNLSLGNSLRDVLDLSAEGEQLPVKDDVAHALSNVETRERAKRIAARCLNRALAEFLGEDGDIDQWLEDTLRVIPQSFNYACDRWRDLYSSALKQSEHNHRIILDPSRDASERERARRERNAAEAQLNLLRDSSDSRQSDFYSYRYFASEGFLPGYNFPRLPLSAFLPGQRQQKGQDEYLSRPRFLAISEFGPRSMIYHEGAIFEINKVIMPVEGDAQRAKRRAIQCAHCGYLHPLGDDSGPDLCEHCNEPLEGAMTNLFRMQNVSTRKRERINSDEEERFRLGYDLKTGVRFAKREGHISARRAELRGPDGEVLLTLVYGHAATIWRMNLGAKRRKDPNKLGYRLDLLAGYWKSDDPKKSKEEGAAARHTQIERVIPYVEDARNCILIKPGEQLDLKQMASLEAALKSAIQIYFQLEDRELASEPLPSNLKRNQLLFFESAEGGAGVLRRMVEDEAALMDVLREALALAHFHRETFEDLKRGPKSTEDCEAACYDCILSFFNQTDHGDVDRHLLPELLKPLLSAKMVVEEVAVNRTEQVASLGANASSSSAPQRWLNVMHERQWTLPTQHQFSFQSCDAIADYWYADTMTAVFILPDGQEAGDFDERIKVLTEPLIDLGVTVVTFGPEENWSEQFQAFPDVFGLTNSDSERGGS